MKVWKMILAVGLLAGGMRFGLGPTAAQTPTPRPAPMIFDHTSDGLYDQLKAQYGAYPNFRPGENIRSILRHASIGFNLQCGIKRILRNENTDPSKPPPECILTDINRIFDWQFEQRGNPSVREKIDDFFVTANAQRNNYDVFMFKYCFFDYIPLNNYGFTTGQEAFTYQKDRIEAEFDNNPAFLGKTYVYWTMPLTALNGHRFGNEYNNAVRAYVRANNKILFDIADMETYGLNGQPTYGNDDSNPPQQVQIGSPDWCKESGESCHPEGDRVPKAYYAMMAYLAGWRPGGQISPTATPTVPVPTPIPGNMDGDGDVDFVDLVRFMPRFGLTGLGDFNNSGSINIFDLNILLRQMY